MTAERELKDQSVRIITLLMERLAAACNALEDVDPDNEVLKQLTNDPLLNLISKKLLERMGVLDEYEFPDEEERVVH